MFSGCAVTQPPIGEPGAMQQSSAIASHAERPRAHPAYSVIYSFKAAEDGEYPYASLIDVNGTLYGTTFFGGGISGCMAACGTVFKITTSGKEKVLHSFDGSGDGAYPFTGLLDLDGLLYGMTWEGGASERGTVYADTPGKKNRDLHAFQGGCCDGAYPRAVLINVDSTLYGTTEEGGSTGCYMYQGCGTVFAITTSGKETVLHSFGTSSGDGQYPQAGLLNVKGTLYGTTSEGGAYNEGTVFAMSPSTSGAETILHSFGAPGDGEEPYAGLINVNGTLYGTTAFGGNNRCAENSCGTVFAVTTSGKETVLHSFSGEPDGFTPYAGLIYVKGTLYGTTTYGGNGGCGGLGCGIVFSITPSGTETVLHTFAGYPDDGGEPEAGLLNVNGTLYGTTMSGGSADNDHCDDGCGTVFAIKP
jgi:uncharacterized repeat protein (TIGR03803 family)